MKQTGEKTWKEGPGPDIEKCAKASGNKPGDERKRIHQKKGTESYGKERRQKALQARKGRRGRTPPDERRRYGRHSEHKTGKDKKGWKARARRRRQKATKHRRETRDLDRREEGRKN